jgi:hypothetical protein
MVKTNEGFDTNGRPDDLLARITYDKTIWHNTFIFAEGGEAGTEEAIEKRNRFPKNENIEIRAEFEKELENKQEAAGKAGGEGGLPRRYDSLFP